MITKNYSNLDWHSTCETKNATCAVRINLAMVQLESTCEKQFCQAKIIASTRYGATVRQSALGEAFARFPKSIAEVAKFWQRGANILQDVLRRWFITSLAVFEQ